MNVPCADGMGSPEGSSEAAKMGQTIVVQCKKDEARKCTNRHAVLTLWVSDKDGNNIAQKKVEITCRQV